MPIPLPQSKRYLARKVICGEKEYGLSTVEVTDDGVQIKAFEKETPSTSYVDGTIIVDMRHNRPVLLVR